MIAIPEGIPEFAWEAIGAKRVGNEWHIPERDASGEEGAP